MKTFDYNYLTVMNNVLENGSIKEDRTNTGTKSLFGEAIRVDISNYQIPLLTTKKIFHNSFVHETIWFISGSTDLSYLLEHNVHIWDSWVKKGTERFEYLLKHEVLNSIKGENTGTAIAHMNKRLEEANINDMADLDLEQNSLALNFLNQVGGTHKKLVGGSIGTGAYGAMWRRWEDTRIVPSVDLQIYLDRGYTFVSSVIPEETTVHNGVLENHEYVGKTIVTREIDQLANAIDLLRHNPDSRRILVSAWNPGKLEDAQLPPCHTLFQFNSRKLTLSEIVEHVELHHKGELNDLLQERLMEFNSSEEPMTEDEVYLQVAQMVNLFSVPLRALSLLIYCRSQDLANGTPFNVAQYALLAHMVAQCTGHLAVNVLWVAGDVHLYSDQINLANMQIKRIPYDQTVTVALNPNVKEINDFVAGDITVQGYLGYHPAIKYPVAV